MTAGIGSATVDFPDTPTRVVLTALTFRRPVDVAAIVPALVDQASRVSANYLVRVQIVDNDPDGDARAIVEAAAAAIAAPVSVAYVHEPMPGISAARNRALAEADDDILVFIDDDERPVDGWLLQLLACYEQFGRPAAVVGPVISVFSEQLDAWVAAGGFFDRRRLPTGTQVDVAATNNLLLDLATIRRLGSRFDPGFGISGGEDSLFTRKLDAGGERLVWCDEAIVFDIVPAARATREWVLLRAFSMGNSWARVSLALASSPLASNLARASGLSRGLTRVVGGCGRWLFGLATRSIRHEARGRRTMARGAGLLAGVVGYRYDEYRR